MERENINLNPQGSGQPFEQGEQLVLPFELAEPLITDQLPVLEQDENLSDEIVHSQVLESDQQIVDEKHAHHWEISPPGQRFSRGKCKICGAERDFDNAPLEFYGSDRVNNGIKIELFNKPIAQHMRPKHLTRRDLEGDNEQL